MKIISKKIFLLCASLILSFSSLSIISPKASAVANVEGTPVYRFFSLKTGAHLYTNSEIERDAVSKLTSEWLYEGPKYYVYPSQGEGTVAVHRFFNSENGSHLYTTNEDEKNTIASTLPKFKYEGIKYYVYSSVPSGNTDLSSVHRFFNLKNGAYLFTTNENEKNTIISTLSNTWRYEGSSFFAEPMNNGYYKSSNMNFSFNYPLALGNPTLSTNANACTIDGESGFTENIQFKDIAFHVTACGFGAGGGGGPVAVQLENFTLNIKDSTSMSFTAFYWDDDPNKYIISGSYNSRTTKFAAVTIYATSTPANYNTLKTQLQEIVPTIVFVRN